MNWKSHLIIGVLLSLIFVILTHSGLGWYSITPSTVVIVTLIILISPLIPDIDHEQGKLQQWLVGTGIIIALIGLIWFFTEDIFNIQSIYSKYVIVIGVVITTTFFFISQFAKHRGFIHTIQFCLIYGFLIFLITKFNIQFGVLGAFACWTHLIADKKPFKI